jgi:hypothetical protein
MKNKKLLYILIPCTLLLWGMIVYKIVSVVSSDNASAVKNEAYTSITPNNVISDTFSLHPSYRDPFLGNIHRDISFKHKVIAKQTTIPTFTKYVRPFPQIIYSGIIKNAKSNKQLVMVQINGQSHIMKIGDIIGAVELTKVFRDSIGVEFENEMRFILK